MLNVAMPEVLLDGTGIRTFIGEIKTAGMPEHVRMNGKREASDLSCSQHNMPWLIDKTQGLYFSSRFLIRTFDSLQKNGPSICHEQSCLRETGL